MHGWPLLALVILGAGSLGALVALVAVGVRGKGYLVLLALSLFVVAYAAYLAKQQAILMAAIAAGLLTVLGIIDVVNAKLKKNG